jgi:murein DD-endopeptidase MepM/ murein hydrolase activator NlpD
LAAAAGTTLLLLAGSAPAAPNPPEAAQALGVLVKVGGGDTASFAVAASPFGRGHTSVAYPGDGSVASVSVADTDAHVGPGVDRSGASAALRGVSLFGGDITASAIEVGAAAYRSGDRAEGALTVSAFDGVTVLGKPVAASANARLALGDWGYVVVLEQAVDRVGSDGNGYRGLISGLHVYLTADHGGLPAGSEILVGYAEAAVRLPEVPASPSGGTPGSAGQSGGGGQDSAGQQGSGSVPEPTPRPPGAHGGPPPIVQNPPRNVRPAITGLGYVFPVYGPASFSDDFGAPRSDTVWHHGNDIFAPVGSPVLAVADGVLFSVGWNTLGGNRLWLRDAQGNEYYYAHLSAYAPQTRDGATVHAGDVIGFVGDTGDAKGTPSHLHFEIHPRALLGLGYDGVIDPYEYLLAWHRATDVSGGFATRPPRGEAPQAPAGLLEGVDISTASGLVPGALERAAALPEVLDTGAELELTRMERPLVGGAPGLGSFG